MRSGTRWGWFFGVGMLASLAVAGADERSERTSIARSEVSQEAPMVRHDSPVERDDARRRAGRFGGLTAVLSAFLDLPNWSLPCFECGIYEMSVNALSAAYDACASNIGEGPGRPDPRHACGTLWAALQGAKEVLEDCERQGELHCSRSAGSGGVVAASGRRAAER